MAVKLESMIEQTPEDATASWARVIEALTGEMALESSPDAFLTTRKLAFDPDNNGALVASLSMARDNARQVREALSVEVWENLNRLYLRLSPVAMESHLGTHAGAPVPRSTGRHARSGRRDLFHSQPW